MTMTDHGGGGAASLASDDRLDQIEAMVRRVRAGELDTSVALSRIATLARGGVGGEAYQKPWG